MMEGIAFITIPRDWLSACSCHRRRTSNAMLLVPCITISRSIIIRLRLIMEMPLDFPTPLLNPTLALLRIPICGLLGNRQRPPDKLRVKSLIVWRNRPAAKAQKLDCTLFSGAAGDSALRVDLGAVFGRDDVSPLNHLPCSCSGVRRKRRRSREREDHRAAKRINVLLIHKLQIRTWYLRTLRVQCW